MSAIDELPPNARDLFFRVLAARLTGEVSYKQTSADLCMLRVRHHPTKCERHCDSDQELEAVLRGDDVAWSAAPERGTPGARTAVMRVLLMEFDA